MGFWKNNIWYFVMNFHILDERLKMKTQDFFINIVWLSEFLCVEWFWFVFVFPDDYSYLKWLERVKILSI